MIGEEPEDFGTAPQPDFEADISHTANTTR
jgi:hypothetical protein